MRHERLTQSGSVWVDVTQLLSVLFLALALVPTGAHTFELPNKLYLPPADYLTVQSIYRGWALFGIVVFGAVAATGLHTYLVRKNDAAFLWSMIAFCCVVATQFIFWAFTYPMNVLTDNWTIMPPDLDAARRQWEYSHAASGVLNFVALIAIMAAVHVSRPYVSIAILNAIEKDIAVRVARARAVSLNDGMKVSD